ncbi:MAG: PIN domain-containing protein [Acidimicrobiales bacterium]
MSRPKRFVDTNVWVYALDESPEEAAKHAVAVALLEQDPDSLVVSTQILQEVYVAVTRKLRDPLPPERAYRSVRALTKLEVVPVDVPLALAGIETARQAQISLWDALVVQAAKVAGCSEVLTEDLNHGQAIVGVSVQNPFLQLEKNV